MRSITCSCTRCPAARRASATARPEFTLVVLLIRSAHQYQYAATHDEAAPLRDQMTTSGSRATPWCCSTRWRTCSISD